MPPLHSCFLRLLRDKSLHHLAECFMPSHVVCCCKGTLQLEACITSWIDASFSEAGKSKNKVLTGLVSSEGLVSISKIVSWTLHFLEVSNTVLLLVEDQMKEVIAVGYTKAGGHFQQVSNIVLGQSTFGLVQMRWILWNLTVFPKSFIWCENVSLDTETASIHWEDQWQF